MFRKLSILTIFSLLLFYTVTAFSVEKPIGTYLGNPPVIPHGVESIGRTDCLACHKTGLIVGGIISPVAPHPELLNCRQCHLNKMDIPPFKINSFKGLLDPQKTYRQNPYAAPLIPHRTYLFKNCVGCHKNVSLSDKVVQTNHAERQNCKQCHLEIIDREIFRFSEKE